MNSTFKSKMVYFVGCLFFFFNLTPIPAQKPAGDKQGAQAELLKSLMQGMQQQRALLQSGEFKADVAVTFFPDKDPTKQNEDAVRVFLKADCFFADDFQQFRFDQDVKQVAPHPQEKDGLRTLRSQSKYVKTPKYSIHTEGDNTSVRINNPEYKPYGYFSPFDIRVIGLINDSELLHGKSHSGSKWFLPSVLERYQAYRLENITRLSAGIYQVTWLSGKSNKFKLVLSIDERQGFTPTQYTVYRKRGTPQAFEKAPYVDIEVTWKEVEDVWVPVALKTEGQSNQRRLEMKFKWLKVNQPVAETVFTVDGMILPAGRRLENDLGESGIIETSVIDHRFGTKRLIRGGTFIPDHNP